MTHIYYDICKSLRTSFTKPRQLQTLVWNLLDGRKSHRDYCSCPVPALTGPATFMPAAWISCSTQSPSLCWKGGQQGWAVGMGARTEPNTLYLPQPLHSYMMTQWATSRQNTLHSSHFAFGRSKELLPTSTFHKPRTQASAPQTALMVFLCWLSTRNFKWINNGEQPGYKIQL